MSHTIILADMFIIVAKLIETTDNTKTFEQKRTEYYGKKLQMLYAMRQ